MFNSIKKRDIIVFIYIFFNNKVLIVNSFQLNAEIFGPLDENHVIGGNVNQNMATNFLKRHNTLASKQCYYSVTTQWDYETNITQENRDKLLKATADFNKFLKQQSFEAKSYDWSGFDESVQRQLQKLAIIGTAVLEGDDGITFTKVLNEMQTIYSTAKVCISDRCGLELDPDLIEIMAKSSNYSELLEVWLKWREVSGKQMRDKFILYYNLGNRAAKLNAFPKQKFNSLTDLWLFHWETPDIRGKIYKLLKQLLPFYQKLHAFLRIRLNQTFREKMPKDLTIPAHLLSNMWAQQWANTLNTVKGVDPYPQTQSIDVTNALRNQQIGSKKMFEMSEKFMTDLGLDGMTDKFWNKSVFEKPKDGTVMVCHASAWDFCTTDDFRIKQCTQQNMDSLIKVFHEMGHIQYYMLYKHQPILFRDGANPGFHEAIGDSLALSVSTPKHLNKIGLLDINKSTNLTMINLKFQLKMALDKVVLLPFAYVMDKWRTDVFSGKVSEHHLNRHWWTLRGRYQGISPPVKRSEKDFDPGAKYHIANSVEYMRYFVSHVLQFQFHKALCGFGQKDVPLYECDIDGDKEAGNKLKEILAFGSSEKWPKLLERLTGSPEMDVKPLLEYFQPLQEFLDQTLKGQQIGWDFEVDDYFETRNGF